MYYDPNAILASRRPPTEWTGIIPTFSGHGFRPLRENPGIVLIEDIAHGTAHTYRYGGQADPGVTVAEHSVLVSRIIEVLWPDKPHMVVAGFFHDAVEAYMHDLQSPVRKAMYVLLEDGTFLQWDKNDDRINAHIGKVLGFTLADIHSPEVRCADMLAVAFEKRDCKNLHGDWGLPDIPDPIKHLKMDFHLPPAAKQAFLDRATELGVSTRYSETLGTVVVGQTIKATERKLHAKWAPPED